MCVCVCVVLCALQEILIEQREKHARGTQGARQRENTEADPLLKRGCALLYNHIPTGVYGLVSAFK